MHHSADALDESASSERQQFCRDVVAGLSAAQKWLPSKYFYDQRGSQLFDAICELDEYYPTRTEMAIMRDHAPEMARQIGAHTMLIELGSGSSTKTALLLEHLPRPVCYVPVDISGAHMQESAARINEQFEDVEVQPLHADFTRPFSLPACGTTVKRRVAYFPGSTIGNFRPDAARDLLQRIATLVGPGGGLLIGFDLIKEPAILEAAYNDAAEVTAEFNKNLLRRINRELDGDFSLSDFEHQAVFNRQHARIEMHLVSTRRQVVSVAGEQFAFAAGETIRTELSHKYDFASFAALAHAVGFAARRHWTDPSRLFAVAYFSVPG